MLIITVDDAHTVLGAVIKRALRDVNYGTPAQQADALSFLDHICPHWQEWPERHQQLAATIAAQRLAAAQQKTHRTGPNSTPARNSVG